MRCNIYCSPQVNAVCIDDYVSMLTLDLGRSLGSAFKLKACILLIDGVIIQHLLLIYFPNGKKDVIHTLQTPRKETNYKKTKIERHNVLTGPNVSGPWWIFTKLRHHAPKSIKIMNAANS